MNKLFFCVLLLVGGFAQANPVRICDPNSSASITFEVTGKLATVSDDEGVAAVYSVEAERHETTTDDDMNDAVGEEVVSYTVYSLVDIQTKVADVLSVANALSGAQHLVLLGPLGELIDLGSSANCP